MATFTNKVVLLRRSITVTHIVIPPDQAVKEQEGDNTPTNDCTQFWGDYS